MLNFCANNYLGLADHPDAGRRRQGRRSTATATACPRCASSAAPRTCTRSSRRGSSAFLGTEDTILYSSCFDANGGLFETLLGEEDAIISDALNHASIIDGVRLCKAQRYRYANNDMADLERCLQRGRRRPAPPDRHRRRLLDGRHHRQPRRRSATSPSATTPWSWSTTATPPASSARPGAARPSTAASTDRVDILTGTLGKALGGASGGFTSGRREVDRDAAPALAALPLLQHAGAGDRRRLADRARPRSRPATTCARGSTRNAAQLPRAR